MTKEQAFFIQVLSDHLNGRNTEKVNDLDWSILLCYARRHQVSGIFNTQAKRWIPSGEAKTFQQEMLATFYCQANRENDLKQIRQMLREAKIPNFIIKGPVVAKLFPIPQLRAMGDIDMVIRTEDRNACHEILLQRGYQCVTNYDDREWQYYKNNMELELHDHLVYEEAVNEKGQDEYFNDCWGYVHDGQLDWSFHLLFLIFHLRKHLMNSGVGFRQFMDLAIVALKIDIDWEWLEDNLQKTGMFIFAKKCYGFIYRWFGIVTPIMEEPDDIFFEQATEKIFADGVFGFGNSENADSAVINQIRGKRLHRLGMMRIAMQQVFPSSKELKRSEHYAYLKEYPVLLPVAWGHRIIRGYKKIKGETVMNKIRSSFVSQKSFDKRNEMLRNWGL